MAYYGAAGTREEVEFCPEHKREGMVNVVHKTMRSSSIRRYFRCFLCNP